MIDIKDLPADKTIHACIERQDSGQKTTHIRDITGNNLSFLIGPEGGFTDEEIIKLETQSNIKPISLGPRILRAETASILCLAHANLL